MVVWELSQFDDSLKFARCVIGKKIRLGQHIVGKGFRTTSFALADPVDKFSNFRMSQQRFDRVVVSPQLFLARHKFVNGPVAVAAHGDCHLHLLARISRLKPLVAVAATRNQMVLGRSQFDDPTAQLTRIGG